MGTDDLVSDERLCSNRARVANRSLLTSIMTEWTSQRRTADIVALLGGHVPVGPVNTASDLFKDEHLRIRRMLVEIEQPGCPSPAVFAGPALHFTETPIGIYRRPPKLGEHNEEVRADIAKSIRSEQ